MNKFFQDSMLFHWVIKQLILLFSIFHNYLIKKIIYSFRIKYIISFFCVLFISLNTTAQISPDFINVDSYPAAVTSITVEMPSGSNIGDVVLVNIVTDDDGAITQPTEFTELAEFWQGGNGPTSGLYYRVIDGSEAATYSFAFSSEPAVVATLRFNESEINSASIVDAILTSIGNDANPLAPSVTTTSDSRTVLQFVAVDGSNAGVLASNTASNTVLAAQESGPSAGAELMITSSIQEAAGATPLGSYTFASEQWTTITLALNTYYIDITSPISENCITTSTTLTANYEVANASGTFELVDPLGSVVSTESYSSSSGMVSFAFTPALTGNYVLREQSSPALNSQITIYVDTDGDTVCDLFDMDDDNDGVIDNVESPNCYLTIDDVPYETGDRTALISVSTEWTVNNGTLINILDGDTGANAIRKTNGDFAFSGQEFLHFILPVPVSFDQITIHHEGAIFLDSELVGVVQGSTDGTTWTDLTTTGTVLPDGASPHVLSLTQNLANYKEYRIFVNSGTIDDDEYLREVEFSLIFNPLDYPLSNCTDDVDGDMIPNHLDLDSDDDGCSDALEASATSDVTVDYQFPSGGAGANGLPDVIETSAESGIINYTSTYNPEALYDGITACLDSDGDSVIDANDMDDDNDGIPDAIEDGYCNLDYSISANKALISITSNTGLGGAGGLGVLLNGNTSDGTFWFTNSNWAGDEIIRLEFPLPTILTGLEYLITNDHMQDYGTVTKIQGSDDGETWVDMAINAEFTMVAPDNTPGVLSSAPFAHTFLWNNEIAYLYYRHLGVSGGGNPTPFVNELILRTASPALCDFDEDGLPNSKDLDSDGDGIPDNIEAQTTATYVPPTADSQSTYLSNNGLNSAYLGGMPIPDTNLDATPDFLDLDSDSDRIPDSEESGLSVTGVIAPNGLDAGVKTSDDYSDVNGVVNNPDTDLAKVTTNTSEVDYRDKQPPPQITICYNNNGAKTFGGSTMTFHDDKVLNPTNFGENGFAYVNFDLVNMGSGLSITAPQLIANGCEIFFMGGSGSGGATSTSEYSATALDALKAWGESTNNVLIAFQGPAMAMGGTELVNGVETNKYVVAGGNQNPNSLTELGENVISGDFGQTGPFSQGGSFQGNFPTFPEDACAITQDNSDPMRPTGLINSATGDFYFSDYGLVEELGGVSNSAEIISNNDRLFANLMASAAKVVVEGPGNVCSFFFCPAGDEAPVLTASDVSSAGLPVDLSGFHTGTAPASTYLTWHNASPVADENYIGNSTNYTDSGLVFAAFRAADGSCYSPATPLDVTINYPDLEVTISPATATSNSGEYQLYTVTVTNNGDITAPNAKVKIPIPADFQLVLANPSTGAYDSSSFIWSVGQMNNGQSASLDITIKL